MARSNQTSPLSYTKPVPNLIHPYLHQLQSTGSSKTSAQRQQVQMTSVPGYLKQQGYKSVTSSPTLATFQSTHQPLPHSINTPT